MSMLIMSRREERKIERLKVREANRAIALMWATDGIITPHAEIRRKMRLARLAEALNGGGEKKEQVEETVQ